MIWTHVKDSISTLVHNNIDQYRQVGTTERSKLLVLQRFKWENQIKKEGKELSPDLHGFRLVIE